MTTRTMRTPTGYELITQERDRQIRLGYDAEHDAKHVTPSNRRPYDHLRQAATAYLEVSGPMSEEARAERLTAARRLWPFDDESFKPSDDDYWIRNYIKAGALSQAALEQCSSHLADEERRIRRQRSECADKIEAAMVNMARRDVTNLLSDTPLARDFVVSAINLGRDVWPIAVGDIVDGLMDRLDSEGVDVVTLILRRIADRMEAANIDRTDSKRVQRLLLDRRAEGVA